MSKYKSFHVPGSSRHYLPDKEYRTEHIRVQLKVDPEAKTIAGDCSLRIETIRDGLSTITFDACEMTITRVIVDGKGVRFDYDGRVLKVWLETPGRASKHEVVVEYSARPVHGVYFVHPDESYPNKPIQAWTQSESVAARFWFPCHDHPDDRSTTETIITVPDGYQVISTGKLVSKKSTGGWSTFNWSESAPHSTYLNSFVVGKFAETDDQVDGVPLQYYLPEERSQDTMRYFGLTPDMMKVFVEITDYKYPYEKYAQVAVHDFIYGGMENISATTLVDNRIPDARSEEDFAARYSRPDRNHVELVAHELAHMWFGDLITAKDWSHAWLNEGFATYMEAVFHEKKYGKDEFRQNMWYKAENYFEEDSTRYRRSIVEDDYLYPDDLFDAYEYEKAAWMLHQLRYLLGDADFFRGVKEYVRRFAYKNADTHDFMRVVEETTGISLEQYFEQSFYRAGHPELEVEYSWDEGSKLAAVSVKQTQAIDAQTPLFQFPCDLVYYTEKGREARRVWVRSQQERFSFQFGSEPTIVEIDPEGWILKRVSFKKSRSLLTNQLESSVDVLSRKQAAEDLSYFKDEQTVDLLREVASKEQYWSVRAEAVRSIGKVGGKRALQALLGLRATRNKRVRRAVVAALGEFKGDARAQEAIEDALFHDDSPYIQCEAALSLARSGATGTVAKLREAMKLPSPESGLTEASLEAMGMTRTEEARVTIRENLPYGKPTRVRVGALKGFTKLGSLQDSDVPPLKEMALEDKDFVVRSQLLMTIGELRDKRFSETLEEVASKDPDNRNRRKAVEILVDFQSLSADAAVTALREQVEKLKAENVEIREKLSRQTVSG